MDPSGDAPKVAPQDVAGIEGAQPVETPADVERIVDPVSNQPASGQDNASDASSDIDAVVRAAKAARDGTGEQAAQVTSKVCLVVDDSRVIRKVTSKIARSLGYTAIEAQDGIEALALCRRGMPHLVLTDWEMPEMNGIEFVRQLRSIPTAKPPTVVFCTSKGEVADIHEGVKAGADDYIVKPFDESTLRAKLVKLGQG